MSDSGAPVGSRPVKVALVMFVAGAVSDEVVGRLDLDLAGGLGPRGHGHLAVGVARAEEEGSPALAGPVRANATSAVATSQNFARINISFRVVRGVKRSDLALVLVAVPEFRRSSIGLIRSS